ncbi:hypothetical protein DKX38_027704 [Salix brachista]|uniref:LIM zinc-binding domain-containing protein n=1 Tax=Salix brachista TaxID=2182728 RepID=A0A5N5J3J9_9ROSI|nr:hypothetical protein DKX38_027704 [Salix brachista]
MAAFAGTQQKCMACDKTVYLVDKLTADNRIFHKACFRCHHCRGTLKESERLKKKKEDLDGGSRGFEGVDRGSLKKRAMRVGTGDGISVFLMERLGWATIGFVNSPVVVKRGIIWA